MRSKMTTLFLKPFLFLCLLIFLFPSIAFADVCCRKANQSYSIEKFEPCPAGSKPRPMAECEPRPNAQCCKTNNGNFFFAQSPEKCSDVHATESDQCVNTQNATKKDQGAGGSSSKPYTAKAPVLQIPLPDVSFSDIVIKPGETVNFPWLAQYLGGIYKLSMILGTILAVVMIMVGGFIWLAAAGNQATIGTGKNYIEGAFVGLLLLLGTVVILKNINPTLLNLKPLKIESIQGVPIDHLIDIYGSDGIEGSSEVKMGVSGWQDCMANTFGKTKSDVENQMTPVTFQGKPYRVHKTVAPDFQNAFTEIEQAIAAGTIKYEFPTMGTYAWRANRNKPAYMSVHAFGVGIDINPDKNPNCTNPPCSYDMPPEVVAIFKKNSLGWGGNWKPTADYMHFSTSKYCGSSR
jgi:hypothetical protein